MASVMAETEQKMEVTWFVGLLTSALNHVEGKYKEGRLLEIRHFNSLSAASSWLRTLLARFGAAWPDGLKLASPRSPPLAITVNALSTPEEPCDMLKLELCPVTLVSQRAGLGPCGAQLRVTLDVLRGRRKEQFPAKNPRDFFIRSQASPGPLQPHPRGTGEV